MSTTQPSGKPFARLEDAQRFLEQRVYDHFRQASEWPRARDFDLDYHALLDPLGGLEVVCRQIGTDRILCGSPMSESDRVALRLPALAACEGSETDVANFLAAVRLAADRYHATRGKEADLKVADLVEALTIDEPAARRALELMLSGDGVSGGGGGGRVQLAHLASRMRGVASLEDYLARVAADVERRQAVAQAAAGRSVRRAPRPARRIFLSHAADDAALAHYLADVIRQGSQATVFVASKAGDIPTGSDWLGAIEEELKKADTYLLLLTPFSVKRFWLWYESGAAWMSDRPFVPVTAAGLPKADVPYPLGARQALSLEDPADAAQLARDLGATIPDVDRFCETVTGLCESLPWRPAPAVAPSPIRVTLERHPDRLVLTNVGPVPVGSVNLTLDEPKNPILEADRAEKLPVPVLEPGQGWPLLIALTMGHAPPYHGAVEWVDPEGRRQTREVYVGG